MKTFVAALFAGLVLLVATASGQVPPDSLLRFQRFDLALWQVLPNQPLVRRNVFLPTITNDIRFFFAIVVDPRSNEIWGVQQDGRNPASAARIEINGTHYRVAEEILLPYPVSGIAGSGFDDDGNWVICASTGYLICLDLLHRRIVRTTILQGAETPIAFAPARRGRPALFESYIFSTQILKLSEIDENGSVGRVFLNRFSTSLDSQFPSILTTDSGRSFVAGLWGGVLPGLFEVNYVTGALTPREHLSPNGGLIAAMEDPSREILHLIYSNSSTGFTRGVYDLRTNRVISQRADLGTQDVRFFAQTGWFPRNQLFTSPRHPTSGTSFDSVLAVGGDPGSAGLLWFDRARIGGVTYGGISTVVATGLLNANGIFRTQLHYHPSILPLQAGDQLYFEGFSWNGNALFRTGEQALTWR